MTRFHFERPDRLQSNAQNISIHLNEFVPPQGIGGTTPPLIEGSWINDLGITFVDDLGNIMVFAP